MSIEPSPFDISFEMSAKDSHVFRFASDGSIAGKVDNQELLDRASDALRLWRTVQGVYDVEFAILRGPDRFSAIYARGGVILEGSKPANVGLVRKSLAPRAPVPISAARDITTGTFTPKQQVLWALAERFARIETPRTFDFRAGETTFKLSVTKNGFGFLNSKDSIEALHMAIDHAIVSGSVIDFGMEPPQTPEGAMHAFGDLFRTSKNDWVISRAGWHTTPAADTCAEEVYALSALGQAAAHADLQRADFFAASGIRQVGLTADADGFSVFRSASARAASIEDL